MYKLGDTVRVTKDRDFNATEEQFLADFYYSLWGAVYEDLPLPSCFPIEELIVLTTQEMVDEYNLTQDKKK